MTALALCLLTTRAVLAEDPPPSPDPAPPPSGLQLDPPPAVGAPSAVTVLDDRGAPRRGETVRVVHRPGTTHARERAIGITDGRGRVEWTPEQGGLASIRVGERSEVVRVAWSERPAGTLTLLVLLALASLGAVGAGLRRRPGRLR